MENTNDVDRRSGGTACYAFWTPWGSDAPPPPEFTDDLGVKYWRDRSMQDYAKQKGVNAQCLFAELPSGERQRVIVENGRVVFESPSMEAVACRLDVMAFA